MKDRMSIADGLTAYRNLPLCACVVCMVILAGCRRVETETTVGMNSPEPTWMRVLLFGNLRRCTAASENGFSVEDAQSGVTAEFQTAQTLPVCLLEDRILIGEHTFGREVVIKPNDPYVFYLDDDGYRGYLRLRVKDDNSAFEAINHVPLESYLLGVVGEEMHSYWEPQALKAQAVAARTYGLFIKNRFGAYRHWDVSRTQSNQVYNGLKAETAAVKRAVLETAGQTLVCVYPNGEELIFPAYYSSSCGGHTENAKYVFGDVGDNLAPLGGVECPYCQDIARRSDFYWKPVTFTGRQVNEKLMERYSTLSAIEPIVELEVTQQGFRNRITRVQLIGKNGQTDWLRGEDFRLALDPSGRKLKSAIFTITKTGTTFEFTNGRGFGHGAGLCQCGAQGMARNGSDYRWILQTYFPGSKLITIQTAGQP